MRVARSQGCSEPVCRLQPWSDGRTGASGRGCGCRALRRDDRWAAASLSPHRRGAAVARRSSGGRLRLGRSLLRSKVTRALAEVVVVQAVCPGTLPAAFRRTERGSSEFVHTWFCFRSGSAGGLRIHETSALRGRTSAHIRCVLVRNARHFGVGMFLYPLHASTEGGAHMKIRSTKNQMPMLCAAAAAGNHALLG